MNKTVIVVLVAILIAGMVVLVLLGDPPPPPSGPTGLWPEYAAADVTEMAWTSGSGEIEVRRSETEEDAWEVRSGEDWVPAEGDEIDDLLNEIDRVEVLRREASETIDANMRESFGLVKPSRWLRFRMRDRTVTLYFGGTVATDTIYAALGEEDDVVVIGDDLQTTALELTPDRLRRRRIFRWTVDEVGKIEVVRGSEKTLAAHRMPNDRFFWWAEVPFEGYLLTDALEGGILAALLGLKATEFVDDSPDVVRLEEYGLVQPAYRVTLRRARGGDAEKDLEIGRAVPDAPGKYYFKVRGQGSVYVGVLERLLEELAKPPAELRDNNLTRLGWRPLGRVRGEFGDTVFRLDRLQGVWTVSEPEGMTADADAVEGWFKGIRDLAIREYVPAPDLAALGLDEPSGRLTFWMPAKEGEDIGEVAVSLHLGKVTENGIYVRRVDQEDVAYVVGPELLDLIRPGAWQFRAKSVFSLRRRELAPTRVAKTGVLGDYVTEYRDGAWTANAHPDRVNATVDYLLKVNAARWLGPAAGRESGFGLADPPGGTIIVTFGEGDSGREYGLIIGNETEGGRFARAIRDGKPGEAVFVLPSVTLPLLEAPLPMPKEPKDPEELE